MSEPFFSRWSQRKQAQARGLPVQEPAPVQPAPPNASTSGAATAPVRHGLAQGKAPAVGTSGSAQEPAASTRGDDNHPAPLPTLDQARALTPNSDFQPFMQPGVASNVRNAAVKKLFTDPHFNVMDGLDIYIGDYNTPDPMPAGMLQKMVGAQLLGLFDKPAQAPAQNAATVEPTRPDGSPSASPVAGLGENPGQSPAAQECSPVVAQSPPSLPDLAGPASPVLPPLVKAHPEHDHPDLQLQPNHAPASPSPGPSTG
jgi:hypothetical protein